MSAGGGGLRVREGRGVGGVRKVTQKCISSEGLTPGEA